MVPIDACNQERGGGGEAVEGRWGGGAVVNRSCPFREGLHCWHGFLLVLVHVHWMGPLRLLLVLAYN